MEIFWIKCDKTNIKEVFETIKNTNKPLKIYTPNPEITLAAKKDKEFKDILNSADMLLPDWIWLYLWYMILEEDSKKKAIIKIPYFIYKILFKKEDIYSKYWEKICGSDLTKMIIEDTNKNWWNIWIIDLYTKTDSKKIESQKLMPKILKEKYPNVNFTIVKYQEEKVDEIIKEFSDNKVEAIFSTLWMKKQEISIDKILPHTNAKVWLWIWGSIDYLIW